MSLRDENLVERYGETIAQFTLEHARGCVTYFARSVAITRYGTRAECPVIDRTWLWTAIEGPDAQYEHHAHAGERFVWG